MAFESKPKLFFEVERVIGVSGDGGCYQVQWAPAWVSKFHLEGCEHLVKEFLLRHSARASEPIAQVEMPYEENGNNEQTETHPPHNICNAAVSEANDIHKEQEYLLSDGVQEDEPVLVNPVETEKKKIYLDQPEHNSQSVLEVTIKTEELEESAEVETLSPLPNTAATQASVSWNPKNHDKCISKEISEKSSNRQAGETNSVERTHSISFTERGSYEGQNDFKSQHFPCHLCRKVFSGRNQLVSHLHTHLQQQKSFSCPHCSYSSSRKGNLKTHLLTHTGVKSHTCEICSRAFSLKSHLKRHLRLHTGEKPYRCSNCGKDFTNLSNRNNHSRRCERTWQPTQFG